MQNKWFVGGMAVPAVGLTILTVWCVATQSWLMAIVPALLAAGLFRGVWWAGIPNHSRQFLVDTLVTLVQTQRLLGGNSAPKNAKRPMQEPQQLSIHYRPRSDALISDAQSI